MQSPPRPSVPAETREQPGFFESGARPLYGMAYLPEARRDGAPVVVHCHSLGVEQLTCYRAEVVTARATAALGIPTFRYHARGHGDSSGDFADVTLTTLVEDALAAADRARTVTGAERIVFLGVRFGALVAAHAMAERRDVAGLALWQPAMRGADHFRGMLRSVLMSQVAGGRRPDATVDGMLAAIGRDGHVDVHGYYLHRAIVESASGASLEQALHGMRAPCLLAQIQSRPALTRAYQSLADRLGASGAAVTTAIVAEEPGWNFVSNPAWRSAPLTAATTEWLDALA